MGAPAVLRTRILVLVVVLCAGTAFSQISISGSQAPEIPDSPQLNTGKTEASDLVIHQNVRRVVVDVVVSDAMGNPVRGLTASDFAIAEDGKTQRVHNFDVHDFDSASDSLPKPPASLPKKHFRERSCRTGAGTTLRPSPRPA